MSEPLPPLVLVVTADPVVHEQVRVAAASAGATCRAVADLAAAEASPAVLVLVDARLPGCWTGSPLVPDALLVVVDGTVPLPPGALELPAQRGLLADRVASAVGRAAEGRAGPGEGLVVGIVGAVGGAGTSTLALTLATAGRGRLVDADPARSGTAVATGRGVPPAPPAPGEGWGEDAPTPAALADGLDRASREAPLVVVDLATVAAGTVWRRADAAVLVVPDAVAAALTARAAARHLRSLVPRLVVVVRGRRRGGPGRAAVGEVVGAVPVVGWGRHEALAAAADAGTLDEAVRRGPTAVAGRAVLGLLVDGP
ncbi:hypothetical protein GCM10028777_04530 [Angustibacter speluncae]